MPFSPFRNEWPSFDHCNETSAPETQVALTRVPIETLSGKAKGEIGGFPATVGLSSRFQAESCPGERNSTVIFGTYRRRLSKMRKLSQHKTGSSSINGRSPSKTMYNCSQHGDSSLGRRGVSGTRGATHRPFRVIRRQRGKFKAIFQW